MQKNAENKTVPTTDVHILIRGTKNVLISLQIFIDFE